MSLATVPANIAFLTPIDLGAIELSADTTPTSWIQVALTGEFWHPVHGDLDITPEYLAHMLSNFDRGEYPAPPYQLPVDYEHFSTKKDRKPGDGVAAGWFQAMELRNDGHELWALIEWTQPAAEKIRKKEYRFISPTFFREWISNKGKQIGATMVAAALTNIPFLSMHAITLSNDAALAPVAVRKARKPVKRGSGMKITVKNSAGQDVEIDTDDLKDISLDALSAIPSIAALKARLPADGTKVVPSADFEALQTKLVTLEGNLATLKTTAEADAARAKTAEKQIRTDRLTMLKRTGRIDGTDETYGKSLLEMDNGGPLFDAWHTSMAAKPPKLELSLEHGGGGDGDGTTKTDAELFVEEVEKACDKDPKKDFRDVIKAVELEHPALAKAYQQDPKGKYKADYRNAPSIQNVVDRVQVVRGGA